MFPISSAETALLSPYSYLLRVSPSSCILLSLLHDDLCDCFPFSFTLPQTVFIWHIPVVLGRLSVIPHAKLPGSSCSVRWTSQLPQRIPRHQSGYAPSNLNKTAIFAASNLFYLHLKSGLFSQSSPPSASTQRKHSWRLWNQRWAGPAVDQWLVKTLSIHSCELSIKNDAS